MIKVFFMIFEKYGFQITNLCLLLFLSWKLANNHLRHIANDIKENGIKLEEIDKKLDNTNERVSKLEGKLSK